MVKLITQSGQSRLVAGKRSQAGHAP
ncbi:hypothetical protein CNECB9_5180008 [Cupriavidus necator]|uniref:Uncharacterized protein n=1 Tax=Cupriavidus necator TaxID=106590 RepID=A0A1K0J0V7_CUPNE|nr:hypothetical protein CNECB9_5180008 [Cupriavidus necator]